MLLSCGKGIRQRESADARPRLPMLLSLLHRAAVPITRSAGLSGSTSQVPPPPPQSLVKVQAEWLTEHCPRLRQPRMRLFPASAT